MNLWTGVACLVANPACKDFKRFGDDGRGAYVNIVAWARSDKEFRQCVELAVADLDCILLELEHVQLLDERIDDPESPEELITMRTTAERQPQDIVFGTFHIWVESDLT